MIHYIYFTCNRKKKTIIKNGFVLFLQQNETENSHERPKPRLPVNLWRLQHFKRITGRIYDFGFIEVYITVFLFPNYYIISEYNTDSNLASLYFLHHVGS